MSLHSSVRWQDEFKYAFYSFTIESTHEKMNKRERIENVRLILEIITETAKVECGKWVDMQFK